MTVNVDSMFLAAKHAIPAMRRAGGGAIVNVSSISALRPRGLTASRDRRRKASALGIEGTGWDIGHAVRFLLSDFARYITGHTLVVDGGTSLSAPERDAGGSGG